MDSNERLARVEERITVLVDEVGRLRRDVRILTWLVAALAATAFGLPALSALP